MPQYIGVQARQFDRDDILDLIAKWRDQHIKQAAEWLDLVQKYSQTDNYREMSEASSQAERNNFAAHTLKMLLSKAENGT